MWNLVRVQLAGGVGNANLLLQQSEIVSLIAIPAQAGITSGTTDIVISHIVPDAASTPFPLLTLTNVVTPYSNTPSAVPVNAANVAQSNNVPVVAAGINISITSGVGANVVDVWILTV
jgi:hypothetical protein